MARLVVKSSFVSPSAPGGAAHLLNYVGYIATREGVELNKEPSTPPQDQEFRTREDLPPTEKQERLIRQLLEDFPDSRESLEYEDYLAQPSMASASEFIGRCTEEHFFEVSAREGYIQYIATRPGALREGEHGLWGVTDEPLDLDEVAHEVANHDGNVWTHIISLRREDAVKTGMESAESWRELVRSQTETIAQAMGIPVTDLRWYAAFHNEGHHPHIHMVAYSAGAEPYLGKKGLQDIKSGLAKEIFREELLETYQAQTQYRDDLTSRWREMLAAGDALPLAESNLKELAGYLSHHSGKAIYGYLPKQQRELVNRIVDELGKHPQIQSLYEDWYTQRDNITGIYKGKPEERLPLSENKTFKPLKNAVIKVAAEMAAGLISTGELPELDSFPADADDMAWGGSEVPEPPEPILTTPEEWLERYPYPGQNDVHDGEGLSEMLAKSEAMELIASEDLRQIPDTTPAPVEEKKMGWWTESYKNARLLLYGSQNQEPDPEAAYKAMRSEAATGNPLAQHDLGRMLLQGIGTEADQEAATVQFQKALAGFQQEANGRRPAYWQYRVGKMYAMGYGTEQDFSQAAVWYQKSVALGNPFAAYALAGQYHRGQGVDQDDAAAFRLYEMAANDKKSSSPYAKWELAKMCEQGIGTEQDPEAAAGWYAGAYEGFKALENRQLDDKLVYRLGYMEYKGIGTEQDIPEAIRHFERAAKLNNPSAAYILAKILAEGELTEKNTSRAVELLESLKEDDFYAPLAAYQLAKLYLEEPEMLDVEKGISNLELATQQGNPYAAYKLATILAKGELATKDVSRAVELLEGVKGDEVLGAQAAYQLAKIYLQEPGAQDIEKGISNLELAAQQGNPYASYKLATIMAKGELVTKDVSRAVELLEGAKGDEVLGAQVAYQLAKIYLQEPAVQDIKKGISNLELAAQQGNPYASYKLAMILVKGELVTKDVSRAVELLESVKSDEVLGAQAAYQLGRLQTSDPAVWDMAKGIGNLEFASARGNHFATYALGRIYYFGQGEYHDRELGLKYLRSAADQGNEYAAKTLEQIQKQEVKQEAFAVLGLLRIFERSLKPSQQQPQKAISDRLQRHRELEKKQAQGMKLG